MEQEGQKGQGAFTPGPWRVGADLIRVHTGWRDEGGNCTPENFHRNGFAKTVARIGKEDGDWRPIEQQVADAFLIAAAPDLLEALSEVVGTSLQAFPALAHQPAFVRATAAILKATRGSL